MLILCWLLHCLLLLLSVAFFTLFERKVIGLFHNRLGPNKVSFIGLLQPLLDAFKLLSKQNLTPLRSNKFTYNAAPHIALILALFVWLTIPTLYNILSINYSLIIFFCVSSIIVFSVLLAGWSSNSKYSLIGSLRSVAQSISYEAVFRTLIVLVIVLLLSFSIRRSFTISSLIFIPLLPLWIICTLAETHRAPFDFSESESELVSGFNTEYSGAYFAFIFLSEYAVLLYSCMLISILFFSWLIPFNIFSYVIITLLFRFVFIWIRITFCRFRYDILIITSWKVLLPLVLILFVCYVPLFIYMQ
jgi:NADH-ubiquinone oxidoreductase chain 1